MASLRLICIIFAAAFSQIHGQDCVYLSLKGVVIPNNSYVDVDDIGEGNDALLCHTNKTDCWDGMGGEQREGEWYFPNGTQLSVERNDSLQNPFYRNGGHSVGEFQCKIPDSSGDNQTLSVNIVNISDVTISTSNPITANAGESLTLECSTIIVDGLPENLIAPVFDWLFDREEVSLLDPTTMHMAVMKNNSNNTYFMISTLQFSALSQFHAGMYTCRFGRNPRLEANTTVIIGAPNIVVRISAGTNTTPVVEEIDYSLSCEVVGADNIYPIFTYQWNKTNSTTSQLTAMTVVGNNNSNTLSFDPLRVSDAGSYTCQVGVNSSFLNEVVYFVDTWNLSIQIPSPVHVNISHDDELIAGSLFNLTCSVVLSPRVDVPVNVMTMMMDAIGYTQTNTLFCMTDSIVVSTDYTSIARNGTYTCWAIVNPQPESAFITSSDMVNGSAEITVAPLLPPANLMVTNTSAASFHLTWQQLSGAYAVENYNISYCLTVNECKDDGENALTCYNDLIKGSQRSYDFSSSIEEDSTFNISLIAVNNVTSSDAVEISDVLTSRASPSSPPQLLNVTSATISKITIEWKEVNCSNRNGPIAGYYITYKADGMMMEEQVLGSGLSFTAVGLQPRTSYNFTVKGLVSNITEAGPGATIAATTTVPLEVGILFNGSLYKNNSIISLHDIGEGSKSLFCITNKRNCCRPTDTNNSMTLGGWYFPNSSSVNRGRNIYSIYNNRGPSIVRLNRKQNVSTPNGVYRCKIPDGSDVEHNFFVGVYPADNGAPSIVELKLERDNTEVVCISTGGPPTTVTWVRNGVPLDDSLYEQSQRILNTTTATYANVLHSLKRENLVGMFTCNISNAHDETGDSKSVFSNGITINVSTDNILVGSNASVTCSSDANATRIEWLNETGTSVVSVVDQKLLNLTFNPVSDLDYGKVYICNVTIDGEDSVFQNFTLRARVPPDILVTNITLGGLNFAGEEYNLNCSVQKIIDGLFHTPITTWAVNGGLVQDEDDILIDTLESGKSTLSFNPLRTSHAGNYSCFGNITLLAPPYHFSTVEHYVLDVQISTPVIMIIREPVLYAGANVSLTCNISLKTGVDSNVSVDVEWYMGNKSLTSTTRRVTAFPTIGLVPSITSRLELTPLTDKDEGNFTCKAQAHSSDAFVRDSAETEATTSISVMQRSPSAPDINHTATDIAMTSVCIRWSQKSDDFIKGFNITSVYMGPCTDYRNMTNNISNLNASTRQIDIKGLQENGKYFIKITAYNDKGDSFSLLNITTKPSGPNGSPNRFRVVSTNLTAINISWNPVNCTQQNSNIYGYTVHYRKTSENASFNEPRNTTKTSATISKLDPNTEYILQVRAVNDKNMTGPPAELTTSTSMPKVIGFLLSDHHYDNNSIVNLSDIGEAEYGLFCLSNKNCSGCTFNWFLPNMNIVPQEGIIYADSGRSMVRLNRKNRASNITGIFCCTILDASSIKQNIYVGLYLTRAGEGVVTVHDLSLDKNEQALLCTSTGGPPTVIKWIKDGQPLNVDGLMYKQNQIIVNASSSTYITTIFIHPGDMNQSKVVGNYSCMVSNSRVTSPSANQQMDLRIQGIRVTGHEHALVHKTPATLNCTTDLSVNTMQWLDVKGRVQKNGTDSFLELTDILTITKDLEYTCKVVSKYGSQAKTVTLTVIPQVVSSSLVTGAASAAVSIIVMLAIVILIVATIFIVINRRRHGKLILFSDRVKSKPHTTFVIKATSLYGGGLDDALASEDIEEKDNEKLEMKTFGKAFKDAAMSTATFGAHVEKMHKENLFETEYLSISKEPQKSLAIADTPTNRLRNRFVNILPYEHCRVKLKEIAGMENSDYINASYLDGYRKPSAYVAAQGPLPTTVEDFWRMIWEKQLTTIVMLTQCFEGRKKCERYWPVYISDTLEFGQGIKVVMNSITPFCEYTVRKMTVTRTSETQLQPLQVTQFHFLAWPDHGVPDNCALMLNFIRRVRKLHPYSNPCPLLVHCSAGVGRTGTFIVLDSMLERMKVEDTLNICDFVKQLREQRVLMVQTLAQYVFIHDALKECTLCGQTEIVANEIRKVIDKLSEQHDPRSASTGFEHQFQILGQLKYESEDNYCSDATSEENIQKNRYSNKLPNNCYRVRLKSAVTVGPDYINASFIDGYREKNTYIATQGPLESTVCDFWQMVWERESKCVVLLSELREDNKEMCYCYWPTTEGDVKIYGHISVKLLTEEKYGYCDSRKFEISEDHLGVEGAKTAFTVTQLHFLQWPEHGTLPVTSSLVELMDNVNRVQMRAGNKPMIVMCNDGVGRTGTFICIHAQLERLKAEGVFDIFQFIKSARMQRPGLLSESVHYVLCHEVLADYLESFDTYANFKEVM